MGIGAAIPPQRFPNSAVIKGALDASLAANLPAGPEIGDTYNISVAGSFEDDASILPAAYAFTTGDQIQWDGTNWRAREGGDDVVKTPEAVAIAIKYAIALG